MEGTPAVGHHDDLTIPDEADLWRRIPTWHIVRDENSGQIRPSSAAFDNDPDGAPMSVVLAAEAENPQTALAGLTGFALASFKARTARDCNQGIVRDPLPNEPAHALVFGTKTKSIRRRLAKEATWVVPPPLP
jgi:hypothetical protein